MTQSQHIMDDLLALSMQLHRQAFAQPPVEGWLNSFLTVLLERFGSLSVTGVQVAQVIGNVAVQMASVGSVPVSASEQYSLDEGSPITEAIRKREMITASNMRIYPISHADDAIAVIIIYTGENPPTQQLDTVINTLAVQLGPAIFQVLKLPGAQTGRLTRQIEMMRSLYEVTRNVSSTLESQEVLNRAAKSIVETLQVDHVGIVVFDATKRFGTVLAEAPDNGITGTRVPIVDTIFNAMDTDRKPIVITDLNDLTKYGMDPEFFRAQGLQSIAFIPMFVQGELVGTVGLDSYYSVRAFTEEELEGAVAITSQLGIGVRNTQLYQEIKRRAEQLERVTELSRRVTSTFDRNTIFNIVKEETQKLIETDLISVALRQGDDPMLYLFMLGDGEPAVTEFPVDQTGLRFILSAADPVVLDDISGSEYADYKLLARSRMRAAAIAPLIVGGRAIGAYIILHRNTGQYSAIDLAMLEQIGNQLAIALENARLYAQTLQRAETERLMNQLSSSTQGYSDIQSMVLATVQQIAEAIGAKRARVRLQMPAPATNTGETQKDSAKSAASRLLGKLSEKQQEG